MPPLRLTTLNLHGLLAAAMLAGSTLLHGFQPNPDLLTISPAVARAGSTLEVTIAGTNLNEARSLRFTHDGIQVEPVIGPVDDFYPEGEPVPNRFKVTIPQDVAPGVYEVRSLSYFGLSTARPFLIVEKDARDIAETQKHDSPETALEVELNSGVTGLMDARGFDWYRFPAKAGERLMIEVVAERIDSKADAVLVLYDGEKRELESSRHHSGRDPFIDFKVPADGEYFLAVSDALFQGNKDYFYRLELNNSAHLDFAFPPAGEPGTAAQFTFHGRNLPGGSPGEGLTLNGDVIETLDAEVQVPAEVDLVPGIFPGTPRQGMIPAFEHRIADSNPVRIGFATAPVVKEERTAPEIQKLTLPCEVAGRFDEPGDADSFRFSASKGQTWWIEVISERMQVSADPYVLVERIDTDAKGVETKKKVAENDDQPSFYGPDALDDLNADTLDPALSFTVEEDGNYEVSLINRSAGGSIAHLYRLAIREAQPGFHLMAGSELTKTINNDAYAMAPLLRRGGSFVYRIIALRQDGFDGEIRVEASGLPPGVSAEPLVMSGTTRQGFLALHAAPDAAPWTGPIRITGSAKIGAGEMKRYARSASIIWGTRVFGNARQVRSRLDEEIVLSVIDHEIHPARILPAEDKVWTVAMKEKLEIPFKVEDTGNRKGALQVEVFGFPSLHRSPPNASIAEGVNEGKVMIDFTPTGNFEIKPGRYQFVFQGVGNTAYVQNPEGVKQAETEAKRIEEVLKAAVAEAGKARESVVQMEKRLQEAQKVAASAADDIQRQDLNKEVTASEAALQTARQAVTTAEAKVKRGETLKTRADKALAAATALAKEKSTQFATYSTPITVEVTEAAAP